MEAVKLVGSLCDFPRNIYYSSMYIQWVVFIIEVRNLNPQKHFKIIYQYNPEIFKIPRQNGIHFTKEFDCNGSLLAEHITNNTINNNNNKYASSPIYSLFAF